MGKLSNQYKAVRVDDFPAYVIGVRTPAVAQRPARHDGAARGPGRPSRPLPLGRREHAERDTGHVIHEPDTRMTQMVDL